MSKESSDGRPVCLPEWAAASAPAAGPDSISRIGTRSAVSTVHRPPDESMMKSGASSPSPRSDDSRSFR